MPATVDERVVEMRFDNKDFESNAKESMSTLEKLKSMLNFSGSADNLNDQIKKVDFSGMAAAVDAISDKFSAMGVVGITVLQNITNKAVDAGIKLVKSLTFDNVFTGFNKYQESLKSIQTIKAALPDEDIDSITQKLDKLKWYADETSYDYQSMINNISKFTSSGMDLETSSNAMQGIANMAGLAGAEVSSATHAMDGFAKAIGAGKMSAQNWSWIQTAHMETEATKRAFLEAAEAVGTLVSAEKDASGKTTKWMTTMAADGKNISVDLASFTTTLYKGWLSRDTMMRAFTDMSKYSDFIYLFKNALEEVTDESYTTSDAMEAFDEARRGSLNEGSSAVKAFIKMVEEQTGEVIDSATAMKELANANFGVAESAYKSAQQYRTFADAINATKTAVTTSWSNIFENLFGNVDQAEEVWTRLGDWMIGTFADPFYELADITAEWGEKGGREDLIEGLAALGDAFSSVTARIGSAFEILFGKIDSDRLVEWTRNLRLNFERLADSAKNFFGIRDSASANEEAMAKLSERMSKLRRIFEGLKAVVGIFSDAISAVFGKLKENSSAIGAAGDSFLEFAAKIGDFLVGLRETIRESGIFSGVFGTLVSIVSNAAKIVGDLAGGALTLFNNILVKVSASVKELGKGIKDYLVNADASFKGTNFLGTLSKVLAGLATIDIVKIGANIGKMAYSLTKTMNLQMFNAELDSLQEFAKSILILSAALLILSTVDDQKILTSLATIAGMFVILSKAFNSMYAESWMSPSNAAQAAKGISGIKDGITSLLKGVSGILDSVRFSVMTTALINMAAAIGILALSMKVLSSLDGKEMLAGVGTISLLAVVMVTMAKSLSKLDGISGAAGLIAMALSISVLSKALADISKLSWEEIAKGLSGVAGAMVTLSAAARLMGGDNSGLFAAGVAFAAMAVALRILVPAIASLGAMDILELVKGLSAIFISMGAIGIILTEYEATFAGAAAFLVAAGAMAILANALKVLSDANPAGLLGAMLSLAGLMGAMVLAMNLANGAIVGAAGMVVAAAALNLLIPPVLILGTLPMETVGQGLFAIAAGIAVIVAGGAAAAAVTPGLLALTGALAGISLASVALGAGFALIGAGILSLVTALTMLATAPVSIVSTWINTIVELVKNLIQFIPDVVNAILEGVNKALPLLINIIGTLIEAVIGLLDDSIPRLVEVVLKLVSQLVYELTVHTGEFVLAALKIVSDFLSGIAQGIPLVVASAIELLDAFLVGIAEAAVGLVYAAADCVIAFINGFANAIVEKGAEIREAGANLGRAILVGLLGIDADIVDAAKNFIDGFKNRIKDGLLTLFGAGKEAGEASVEGLRTGIDAHSDSRETIAAADDYVNGYVNEIDNRSDDIYASGENAGETSVEGMVDAIFGEEGAIADSEVSVMANAGAQAAMESANQGASSADNFANSFIDRILSRSSDIKAAEAEVAAGMEEGALGGMGAQAMDSAYLSIGYSAAEYRKKLNEAYAKTAAKTTKSGGGGGGGGSSATANAEKSMQELAQTYKFGETVVKKFSETYGKGLQTIDATVDISKISQGAIDNLAIKLYQLSDSFKEDAKNADITAEETLQHIQKAFQDTYDSIYKTFTSIDIWKTFTPDDTETSAEAILENFQNIQDYYDEYYGNLTTLASRGIDPALMQELINKGTAGAAQVAALARATDDELFEIETAYTGMELSAQEKTDAILATWGYHMTDMDSLMTTGISSITTAFNQGYKNGLDVMAGTDEATAMARNTLASMRAALGINSPSEETRKIGHYTAEGIAVGLNDWASALNVKGRGVGLNVDAGIASGIREGQSEVINAIAELAAETIEAAERKFQIASPSKVFARMGQYVDLGFAKGVDDYSYEATDSIGSLATGTVNTMRNAISGILRLISAEMSDEFVITPVFDLSRIRSGAEAISSLIENGGNVDEIQNGGEPRSISFVQNNYSPKALSRIDIYRQTKNQFSMAKGALSV